MRDTNCVTVLANNDDEDKYSFLEGWDQGKGAVDERVMVYCIFEKEKSIGSAGYNERCMKSCTNRIFKMPRF